MKPKPICDLDFFVDTMAFPSPSGVDMSTHTVASRQNSRRNSAGWIQRSVTLLLGITILAFHPHGGDSFPIYPFRRIYAPPPTRDPYRLRPLVTVTSSTTHSGTIVLLLTNRQTEDETDSPKDPPNDDTLHNSSSSGSNQTTSQTSSLVRTPRNDTSISLAELARLEEESSRKLFQRLLLPQRIGATVTFVLQVFVLVGITLNIFGYAYVRNETTNWIEIDTLEHRQFQMELRKQ